MFSCKTVYNIIKTKRRTPEMWFSFWNTSGGDKLCDTSVNHLKFAYTQPSSHPQIELS